MIVKKGSTDVTTYFNLVDSAAGTPETGLTITNLDLQYTRNQSSPAAKVDATALAATNSAHSDNKAIEIDGASSPGLYRVDWPDAAFATGADKVILCVTCSGVAPAFIHVSLVDYDPADGVRLGLTALPNAAADAAGGLPISDAGGLDLDAMNSNVSAILVDTGTTLDGKIDTIDSNVDAILVDTAEIGAAGAGLTNINLPDQTMNITGNLSGSVGSVTGNVGGNVTGTIGGLTAAALKDFFDTDSTATFGDAVSGSVVKEIADNAGGSSLTVEDIAAEVWSTAARTLTAIDEDATTLDLDATIRAAVGLASANLDTQLDALPTAAENASGVWGAGSRSLTVLDEDSTTLDLDATIRAAVGLSSANLDTQLSTIDTVVDSILADTGTDGVVVAAGSKTGYRLSATGVDDILDEVIEGSYTMRQFLRGFAAALLAKASGLETTNAKYRDTGDSKDRIDATVDVDGNRTAVTLDLT